MFVISFVLIFCLFPVAAISSALHCHMLEKIRPYRGPKVSRFGVYHGYSTARYNSWVRHSQYISMPDGIKLAIDLVFPAINCKPAKKPLPVILMQTPYQRAYVKSNAKVMPEVEYQHLTEVLRHGYIFASFDIRGTASSFGYFNSVFSSLERQDAYHVIEWLAKQSFSNGNIGMYGSSYEGIDQLFAASLAPPHLKAIYPKAASFNLYDLIYPGGIFRNVFATKWTQLLYNINSINQLVPVDHDVSGVEQAKAREIHKNNPNILRQFIEAPFYDQFTSHFSWINNNPVSILSMLNKAHIPIYFSSGWLDIFSSDALFWYANYHGPKKLIIGAWPHVLTAGNRATNKEREKITNTEMLRWFDYWLKGIQNGVMDDAPIHYNTLNKDYFPGVWHKSNTWPPTDIKYTTLYFNKTDLRRKPSINNKRFDTYRVNYNTTSGSHSRWNTPISGEVIQYRGLRYNDTRSLTYTTKPLVSDMTITGFPIVTIYLSSSTNDADIHVLLEAIDKKGNSHYLTEGMLRASQRKLFNPAWKHFHMPYQRHTKQDVQMLMPNKVVKLHFYLSPFSRKLKKGDRIRVAIMGADAQNTDTLVFDKAPVLYVFHDKYHRSRICIPQVNNTRP